MPRTRAILVICAALAIACAPPAPEEAMEIETVDVGQPIDAGLSTEGDLQAVERAAQVSGLVPGDVPGDLPLFVPSSVVGFSGSEESETWVELDTTAEPAVVRRWLGERLPRSGWKVDAVGDDRIQAHKGSQRAEYRFTDLSPGTRVRLRYTPSP